MARVDYKSWSIGPRHDPYGADELTFTTTSGKEVSLYTDGLYRMRVSVDGEVAAEYVGDSKEEAEKLYDLFEEEAGISYADARNAWERLEAKREPDPMGHPSLYI